MGFGVREDTEDKIEEIISSLQEDLSRQGFKIKVVYVRYYAWYGLAYDLMGVVSHVEESAKCKWATIFPLNFLNSLEWGIREHNKVCSLVNCEKAA